MMQVVIDEMTEEQLHAGCSFENDYGAGVPMVVYVHGRLRSALIACVPAHGGIVWADDGALDPSGASHHVDHFVEYPVTGGRHGPWVFGNGTVDIRKVKPGDDDYRAWRIFMQHAPEGVEALREKIELQLREIAGEHL